MTDRLNDTKDHKYTNRLVGEASPYLLQHAHNPVNWYPWSDEALDRARSEDKPIFLSIGYAACHWCHVMEKESFENEEVAEILNDNFVSIKVDREQRPDLDQIYMSATIALTGSGGWPMSVFLTPDLKPFFAGTYFPPTDKYGRPGFTRLIRELADIYGNNRQRVLEISESLVEALMSSGKSDSTSTKLDGSIVASTAGAILAGYDRVNGGFGVAPKFPHATELSFLMKVYADTGDRTILNAVEHSLHSMARGGIYDQLGGGFHRYSVDARWLVPHFEKMLYDNAMLAVTYSEAYQITGREQYKRIVRETLDFMIREMEHGRGGFFSSLDADSDGEEGKYYVWAKSEVDNLLGDDSDTFCGYFSVTESGNFENGTSILHIGSASDEFRAESGLADREFEGIIERSRKKLLAERSKRIRPHTDDKILTSWNGLAISGLSKGYQITRDSRYREAALRAATLVRDSLYQDGELRHLYGMRGVSDGPFLEDYAYLTQGLIDLYEVEYNFGWIRFAATLAKHAVKLFSDDAGNLFLSPANPRDHFMRPKDIADGALPAPGSILVQSLLRLADITGDDLLREQAVRSIETMAGSMVRMPSAMTSAVAAYGYSVADKLELVLIGSDGREQFLDKAYAAYLPYRVIVVSDDGEEDIPLLKGRKAGDKTVAFVCRNLTCQLPANSPDELKNQLNGVSVTHQR